MTKKDYILIAESLKVVHDRMWNHADKNMTFEDVVVTLAGELWLENPAFNKYKFYEACGVEK